MTTKELTLLGVLGFGVWLSGAITFKFGGSAMFENGPWVLAASAVGIALAVCLVLRSIMDWRRLPIIQSVTVAVIMTLGGLFGDVAYILAFHQITGLSQVTAGSYAAVVIFGTAVLFAYALIRQTRAAR